MPDIIWKSLHFGEGGRFAKWFSRFVSLRTTAIPQICHTRFMNKTNLFSTSNLTDLQDFMFDTMLPADDCVDWFCDRHDVNATDEVIDFVVDAHFAFHGE